MFAFVTRYFSEFRILKSASRDFWLTNGIQFFDGLAYFSMITVLSLYLTTNCGFSDVDSGKWVGIYTLYITAFVFAVGSICDVIGIKRSLVIGISLLILSRLGLGVAPLFLRDDPLQLTVKGLIIVMSLGTAFMSPVIMTALRRYTSKETRATGFNVYYLLMNIGAVIANALIVDLMRTGKAFGLVVFKGFGNVTGNLVILDIGFGAAICALVCSLLLREHNWAEPSERNAVSTAKRPLHLFLEVWREKPFQKLVLFLVLTLGVRLVFTHQFLVMPKYYTRMLGSDFELGFANSINPIIIVIGLIVLIPVINRFATIKLIILGMAVSAFSLVFLAVPIDWVLRLPFLHNHVQAYYFIIVTQIVVFAVGELIFSPRFTEYIASVAPPDKVSSYMALSALPMFIAKPINGFISGILISRYCYDGIRPKIETGNVGYVHSPEFMWMIYLSLAVLSPIAVIALKGYLTRGDSQPPAPGTNAS
ncbi:MAG: MFS transporter [Akkermansiaceae bacterium]|nr:MFS transporter [Akkermansiaceae bacterium]